MHWHPHCAAPQRSLLAAYEVTFSSEPQRGDRHEPGGVSPGITTTTFQRAPTVRHSHLSPVKRARVGYQSVEQSAASRNLWSSRSTPHREAVEVNRRGSSRSDTPGENPPNTSTRFHDAQTCDNSSLLSSFTSCRPTTITPRGI